MLNTESQKISKKNPMNFLNNLTFTTTSIKPILEYITKGTIPDLEDRPKKKFLKRFSNDWKCENGNLKFIPLNLIVITTDNIQKTLQDLYDDPVNSLGKGIQAFFDTVKSKYIGISRKDVETFLKGREEYQMTFVKKKVNQKPIYAQYSNEKWGMDLIDMNQYTSQNKQYRYILTVIDFFSRKVFCEKLKTKDLESVKEALNVIISSSKTTPTMIICDNGSEFELSEFCKSHKIKLLHTESHSPTQNAMIENFNGSLRRLIRANFVRNNNLVWIDDLQMLVENYNSKKHKTTKFTPNEIWSEKKNKVKVVDENNNLALSKEEKISDVSKRTISKATKQIEKLQKQTLQVGDTVRVATSSLNSEVRKNNKAGLSKLVVVKFSAKVFTVEKVVKSRVKKEFALDKYILKDKKGNILLTEFNLKHPNRELKPRKFNITELLKIDPTTVNTRSKAIENKLNKIVNVMEYDKEIPVTPEPVEIESTEPRKSSRVKKSTKKLDL